jgi:phage FluMu protein Com
MPIRFRCPHCRQSLVAASRKAGSEIRCPKCQGAQIVPAEEPERETTLAPSPVPAGPPGEPTGDSGMILFPRRTLYIQAVLFVVLALGAFLIGYFVGRGDAKYERQLEQETLNRQRQHAGP